MVTRNLELPELTAQQQEKFLSINESSHIIDAMVLPVVEGITNTVPTVTSADVGRKWIVGTAPVSGSAWGGQANKIAIRITDGANESWKFLTSPVGLVLYLANQNFARYRFSGGTWNEVQNEAIPQSLLDKIEESLVVEDLSLEGAPRTCQLRGEDNRPNNSSNAILLTLTCIGNAPTSGTGLVDGVITINSGSKFTWDGVVHPYFNPANVVATRMPNDGADDAMVQRWIVKGAVFDFTNVGQIGILNLIGATQFTSSFEGTVSYEGEGKAVPPVKTIIGDYLQENPVDAVSPSQATAIAKIPAIETKSNANETAISGLQTTTGELTAAQGATRTIADNNVTELAAIRALIPTDGISGVGDLTALVEDIEANQLRITNTETKNMEQDTTLSELATKNTQQDEAIALNTAKPTNDEVDTRADARITRSLQTGNAIANYVRDNAGSGGGTEGALVLEDLALETTERLCGVSGADTNPSAVHSATLTLECDGETPTEGTASLGGVIRFTANSAWNGKFRISLVGNSIITLATGTATQISGGNTGLQEWRIDEVEWNFTDTGVRNLRLDSVAGSVFTPEPPHNTFTFTFDGELTRDDAKGKAVAPVEVIAEKSIVESLAEGGAIATYVADNAGSGGGVSLEAIANEMRADGDIATIPAETLPDSAQITATAEAQTAITVPDNALFRSLSTINASFSSSIVNAGNSINVGIRYTDDDTIPPTGGLRPSFTNSTIRNFTGVDLTRPIAFFFGMGQTQDISVGDLSFTNTKTGTGSLVDEIEQVGLNALALDTGRKEQICTVTADITGGGTAEAICSDFDVFEARAHGATATFNGEIRFTSNVFTWDGSFTIFGVSGLSATRTSPDGDSNQVWRFDGATWEFDADGSRIFVANVGDNVVISLRGELTIPEKGASAKLVEAIARTIVLDQIAGDITLGGDPIMGGGVRYRTFFNDIPASSLIGGSTQNFTIPSGLDAEVTYLTWAALVLTASTTASNATLWGGDSGASANDRGAVSLNLQQRGSNGEHSFGIARQTHGAAVRISSITATPSSETMIRVSITVRQGGELKLPIA